MTSSLLIHADKENYSIYSFYRISQKNRFETDKSLTSYIDRYTYWSSDKYYNSYMLI